MWNGLIACWVSPFDFEENERSEGDGAESGLQKTSTNAQNDEGDKVSAIKLDWKPLWRGALALLEMMWLPSLDITQGEGLFVAHAHPLDGAMPSQPSSVGSPAEKIWVEKFIRFVCQTLCALKKWSEAVYLGELFMRLTSRDVAQHVLPLVLHAQRQAWRVSMRDVQRDEAALRNFCAEWEEAHKEEEVDTVRKIKRAVAQEDNAAALQAEFEEARQEFDEPLKKSKGRSDALKAHLDRYMETMNAASRDQSKCLEALMGARAAMAQTLRGLVSCEGKEGAESALESSRTRKSKKSVVSKYSRASRRSAKQTARTSKTSKSGRSVRSTRSRRSGSRTVRSSRTNESAPTPFASCISAYAKAVSMARQKQEMPILIEALHEQGDVLFAAGKRERATQAWNDAVDAIAGRVNAALDSKWQEPGTTVLKRFGAVNCAVAGICLVKLGAFAYFGDAAKRDCALKAASASFAALLCGSMQHPSRVCEYADYEIQELGRGIDIFERVDVEVLSSALRFVCASQIGAADALPLAALYEFTQRSIARSKRGTFDAHILKMTACGKLGFWHHAISLAQRVLGGDETATFDVSKPLSDERNQACISWLAQLNIPSDLAAAIGPRLADDLHLFRIEALLDLGAHVKAEAIMTELTDKHTMRATYVDPPSTEGYPSARSSKRGTGRKGSARKSSSRRSSPRAHSPRMSSPRDIKTEPDSRDPFASHSLRVLAKIALSRARVGFHKQEFDKCVALLRTAMGQQLAERLLPTQPSKSLIMMSQEHLDSSWWLECRALIVKALIAIDRWEEADAECKLGAEEALHMSNVSKKVFFEQCAAELCLLRGNIAGARDILERCVLAQDVQPSPDAAVHICRIGAAFPDKILSRSRCADLLSKAEVDINKRLQLLGWVPKSNYPATYRNIYLPDIATMAGIIYLRRALDANVDPLREYCRENGQRTMQDLESLQKLDSEKWLARSNGRHISQYYMTLLSDREFPGIVGDVALRTCQEIELELGFGGGSIGDENDSNDGESVNDMPWYEARPHCDPFWVVSTRAISK